MDTTELLAEVLRALATKHHRTDDGDPISFTIAAIAQAIKQRVEEVQLMVHWLLEQKLAYRPFSYDQRFVSLNDAGLHLANNLPQ